jgi:PAS domain S-box-containing protein
LGLNARILTICGLPLAAMAILASLVVHWSTRRFVEDAIGEQMVMQARIVSHLVAIAEQKTAGKLTPDEINRHLKDITRFAKEHGNYDYEFWVTDGPKVVLGSTGVEFTFTPEQEQAGAFLKLLDGRPGHQDVVLQESQKRQIDSQIFKYVGVSGVDKPRIVEVGYRTESLLAALFWKNLLLAAGVAGLLLTAGILAYALLRRTVTAPLEKLVRAAKDVQAEQYRVGSLDRVRTRGDEMGRLASVFEDMVLKLATRYEELVNLMRSAVLKVRGDGVITFANHYACELFEFGREELVGAAVARIVPPERQDQIQTQLEGLKDQEVRVAEVRQNLTKSGKRLWMSWANRQIKPGDAASRELLFVGNDVTEEVRQKKELEELVGKLAAQKEELRRLALMSDTALELTKAGHWQVPLDGSNVFNISERGAKALGNVLRADGRYHPHDDWAVNLIAADKEIAEKTFAHFNDVCEGRASRYDATYPYKSPSDGRIVWIHALAHLVKDEAGKPKEMLGVNQDITDFKLLEHEIVGAKQKAEEATQMKSMFLANMSHEIRTPMNAIIGLSHLALKTPLNPKQKDYVAKIHNAGTSLLAIINDILDFSKIEAGRLDIERTDFKLDDVVNSVTTVTGQKAHDKGLEYLAEVPGSVPQFLVGDPLRLGQILTNLVNNAIKFTEQGEIRMRAELLERTGDKVKLKFSVRDTGQGMTPEQSAKLFQPFTQADMSTTRKHGGTGLGLTISKRLAELMGGQIWLESEPGKGSSFSFTIWAGVGEPKGSGRVVPDRLQGLKTLVVDDNAAAREILQELLRDLVGRSDAVASGAEALAAVKSADASAPYDIVFMDWRMPTLDGLQTARRIKGDETLGRQPAIVLVTAFGREEVREEAERLKLDGFLLKPVTKSMIVDALMNVFASPSEDVASATAGKDSVRFPGLRILLAEDNAINQQIAVELLQEVGATVDVANHGLEAVEKLSAAGAGAYHLVLMDLQMPEMDGHQATMKIRSDARFAKLPIIAMTAHATTEERQRCLDEGMNDHVSKPIDPALLYETVGRFYTASGAAAATSRPAPAPAPAADGLPEVEGLDAKDGLARVAGNRGLYLKLLRQFADQQGPAPRQISDALAAGDRKLAERLAHTVKGVAGNLGARRVQQTAGELEKAISSGAEKPDVAPLESMLGGFLGRLKAALPAEAAPVAAPAPALDDGQLREFVREMTTHLGNFDPAAGDLFAKHRDSVRGFFSPGDFESIEKQIGSFAFADALATLRQAARQKGISEP